MIRFLFGRPGSGKTYTIIDDIRKQLSNGQKKIWLIIPEQQAFSAERDILSVLPADAGNRFSIVSFSRLCDVTENLYGGRAQHSITASMRLLLMWHTVKSLSGLLKTYTASTSTDTALCNRLLEMTNELTCNDISSEKLELVAKKLPSDSSLCDKLRDLALISASYHGLIREIYGDDPADRMIRAVAKMEEHGLFGNSVVYVDSFSSFTAQEYAVLNTIIRQADDVTFTVGMAHRNVHEAQFDSLEDTVLKLTRMCEDARKSYEDTVLTKSCRTKESELLSLERNLWAFDLTPERRDAELPAPEDRGAVRLVSAPTVYEEAQAIALHILELVSQGIPYHQIAVVVRDTGSWGGILDAALDQYRIPYFLSERTDLNEKPSARLILTALRCVARGWQTADIIGLCKTGLCGISTRDMDAFQEYVETWKLGGKRMTDELWSMNPDGYETKLSPRAQEILQAANRVRKAVMTPLMALKLNLQAAQTLTDQCRAVYQYLCDLRVKEQLTKQAEEHLRLNQTREAGEQVRLWSFLTETLATLATVMSELDETAEILSPDELYTALSLVFSSTDIGSVPARHDCVTIGDASTLRVDNIRAMLVAGLCEGEFPKNVSDKGLLTEQEKSLLAKHGVEFDSRADRLTSEELFYVYRTFTKPSERLILSYSTTSSDGKALSPSAAIMRTKYVLSYLTVETFSSSLVDNTKERTSYTVPMDDTVSSQSARRMLGDTHWLSTSQLKTYAGCPYSYYGSHLLRLREPKVATFENTNAGNFLHHVMEKYLLAALDEDNRIRPMSDREVRRTANRIIEAYIEELCGDLSSNGRILHLFDRLRHIALTLIYDIQAELSQSAFTVAGLEWGLYGKTEADPKPMILPLDVSGEQIDTDASVDPVQLILGGRIDRVDIYRAADNETVYVRVVDYKSSKHEFSVESLKKDMNIQLMLYLFALCSPENRALFATKDGDVPEQVLPAEALYISPDETDKHGAILPCRTGIILNDEEILHAANADDSAVYLPSVGKSKKGELSGAGLYSAEEMASLEDMLKKTILDTAADMYSGRAHRTPSESACRYCMFRGSCASCISK